MTMGTALYGRNRVVVRSVRRFRSSIEIDVAVTAIGGGPELYETIRVSTDEPIRSQVSPRVYAAIESVVDGTV